MKRNVGSLDRILRIIIGTIIIAVGINAENWWGTIGLVPFITGLIGWCPLYIPLRISTRRRT